MNSRATWMWGVTAALLLAFIVVHKRHAAREAARASATVLPHLRAADVSSIQVRPQGTNQLEIRVRRTDQGWQLLEPLTYPAQSTKVEALLNYMEGLMPATYITPTDLRALPTADQDFGFTSAHAASIILSQRDYRVHVLLGMRTAPGDQVFLQVVGQEGAYVVDAELLNLIPRSANDWRDTSFCRLKTTSFDSITVTNGPKVFELQLEPSTGLWRVLRPFPARAHQAKIRESLEFLQALEVQSFVSDDPAADLESYGLQPPQLQIVFRQGTGTVASLEFGRSPTNNPSQVYARRQGDPAIVTVSNDLLTPWRASVQDFRDPHLVALTEPIDLIEIQCAHGENPSSSSAADQASAAKNAGDFSIERQGSNTWRVMPNGYAADAALVEDLLRGLSGMQIVQFVKDVVTEPDLPAYGLAAPERRYVLKSAVTGSGGLKTNGVLADLNFGINTNQPGKIFVRRTDESCVYAITREDFLKLPAAPWQLRERKLFNFKENDIASVSIQQGERYRKILRKGAHDWALAPGSQGVINDLAIEETVRALTQASAAVWVACGDGQLETYGLGSQAHHLTLDLKNGKSFSIDFGKEAPSQYPYAAVKLDGKTWVCEFPWLVYRDIATYLSAPPGP